MNEREDDFLKKAFADYQPNAILNANFNRRVIEKIDVSISNSVLIGQFLKIYLPILFVFLLGFTFLGINYGELVFNFLQNSIPMLKPWHVMVVIGIIYFHFVRSVLFLAFIYLKKQFNFAFTLSSLLK